MIINKYIFKYLLFEFLLCILSIYLLFLYNEKYQELLEGVLGALSLINIIVYFAILYNKIKEVLSISSLFIAFLYLFNLGLPICRILGWINIDHYLFLNRRIYSMGQETFIGFCTYGFVLISMLQLGTIIYYVKVRNQTIIVEPLDYEIQLIKCRSLGKICIFIGIVPYLYSEYVTILNGLLYSYQSETGKSNLSGTGIGLVGNLFILGLFLLLLGLQKNRIKFDILFWTIVGYQIVRMIISGDRSTGVVFILVLVVTRHKFVAPIHGKRVVMYIGIIYFAMLLLKFVEVTRAESMVSVKYVLSELIQSNILVETVFEYGGNIWNGMMVYYSVPSTSYFRCGIVYLAAIIGKPLQILGITNEVWKYADFSYFLQEEERGRLINQLTSAMGGSFSGEWYFNFGWFGIVIIPFFGYSLAKFSSVCVSRKTNPIMASYLLYVATLVIWWTRQYFISVSWYAMFSGVMMMILCQLLFKRK